MLGTGQWGGVRGGPDRYPQLSWTTARQQLMTAREQRAGRVTEPGRALPFSSPPRAGEGGRPARLLDPVDARLPQLVDDPTGDPRAAYDAHSDQWSVPVGENDSLSYAVVADPPTVIDPRLLIDIDAVAPRVP